MKKIRNSNLVKALCILLACTFTYIGCSPESIPTPSGGCSNATITIVDSEQLANNFEAMLDFVRTMDNLNDFTTFGEFHEYLFGTTTEATNFVSAFEEEADNYENLGFENYVASHESLSNELSDYLLAYADDLQSFLSSQHPDLEEFITFISNEKNALSTSGLCQEDQDLFALYLDASQGYAQYFYRHFNSEESVDSPEFRSCNFRQALLCGLLALTVTVVVGQSMFAVILAGALYVNGQLVAGTAQLDFAILAGIALGLYFGINIYNWCCKILEEEDPPCYAPTGWFYNPTDCNQFTYVIWGPSDYEATSWDNDNTNPATATTPTPMLSLSVPDYGDESEIYANVTCTQNTTVYIWEHRNTLTFDSGEPPVQITWMNAPPNSIQQGQTIVAAVNTQGGTPGNMELTWTISDPNTNVINGSGEAVWITYNSSGGANVVVTLTNTCPNESTFLSKLTTITQ